MRQILCLTLLFPYFSDGCGGGGSHIPTFVYVTQWNIPSADRRPIQRIQLFDQNNVFKFFANIDKPSPRLKFFGVANGVYHLHVEIYAQAGFQGTLNGTLDDQVTIAGPITYHSTSALPSPPSAFRPPPPPSRPKHSQQFYATAETASTAPTFQRLTPSLANIRRSRDRRSKRPGRRHHAGSRIGHSHQNRLQRLGSAALTIQLEP